MVIASPSQDVFKNRLVNMSGVISITFALYGSSLDDIWKFLPVLLLSCSNFECPAS